MGQSVTNVSASPPSKLRLNPYLLDRLPSNDISSAEIIFPNHVSSKPSDDTLVKINKNNSVEGFGKLFKEN